MIENVEKEIKMPSSHIHSVSLNIPSRLIFSGSLFFFFSFFRLKCCLVLVFETNLEITFNIQYKTTTFYINVKLKFSFKRMIVRLFSMWLF